MKFERRTEAPSTTNKYYINTEYGGYNRCIIIDEKTGSCIPNCTGYAYGRWSEAQGLKKCSLPVSNAENWIDDNTKYPEGKTPKVGSIIVWSKGKIHYGKDGAGHVAFVEKVNEDGSIETTESGYKSTRWFTKKYKKGYERTGYTFLGFIYPIEDFLENYKGTFPTLPSRGYFKKGDKSDQVKNLQKLLNWCNDSKLVVDGIIGDKTIEQIKVFQKNTKLTVDGLFGKISLNKAKTITK